MTPDDIAATIRQAAANAPRSLQLELGPSEAGEPCTRRLAYRVLGWDKTGRDLDPWAAVQGVAVHAWLADVFRAENKQLGRERYLVEHRVQPISDEERRQLGLPWNLAGSCDLLDRDDGRVYDWKIVSPDRLRKYESAGPGSQYRAQSHLYGRGLVRAGEQVTSVSVVFLPRAAYLTGMYVWTEDYDQAVADAALSRLSAICSTIVALDPERSPGMWGLIPTAPDSCRHCPWLKPGSRYLAGGCPGHLDDATPASSVESLIA